MCRPKTVGYLRRFGLKTGLDSLLREKRTVDEVGTGYGSQRGKRVRQIPGFFEVENFRLRDDFWKGKFWQVFLEYLDFSRDFFGVIKTYVSIFAFYYVMFSGSFYGSEIRHRNFCWCNGVRSRDFWGSTSFPCLFLGGGVDFSPIRSSLSLEILEYLAWGREPKMWHTNNEMSYRVKKGKEGFLNKIAKDIIHKLRRREKRDFLKSISNFHISLSFLLIWN